MIAGIKGHPDRRYIRRDLGTGEMNIWSSIRRAVVAVREFVAPTYRPERHYMRGPGPACARRDVSLAGMAFENRTGF